MIAARLNAASFSRFVPCLPQVRPRVRLVDIRIVHAYYSTVVELPVPNKTKVWASAEKAVQDVKSGDVLLSGGECTLNEVRVMDRG